MSDNQTRQDLERIFNHILVAARSDPTLRTALERQGRRLLVSLGVLPESYLPDGGEVATEQSESPVNPAPSHRLEALVARFQGSREEAGKIPMTGIPLSEDADEVTRLIAACYLKARASDWRIRSLVDGTATVGERTALINEGGDCGIYLWMVTRNKEGELSRDPINFERLESTYHVCARALEAWQQMPITRAGEVLPLIAEAQGMIRVAAAQVGLQRPEDTAQAVYEWLRGQAAELRIYIHRHMRPNDPANPDLVHVLNERLNRLLAPAPFRVTMEPGEGDEGDEGEDFDAGMADDEDIPTTPEVARVAELLRGRTVAMFCGDRRPEQAQALEAAFGLGNLLWETTGDKFSTGDHERVLNHPDLALVLVAVRWLSHSHTGNLPREAAERGIPVVRLPGGYGITRVAYEILEQAGERLAALADPEA